MLIRVSAVESEIVNIADQVTFETSVSCPNEDGLVEIEVIAG